jgi:hypothetical protein
MTTIKLIKKDLKQNGRMGTGFFWLKTSAGGSSCEYGDEPSGSIKVSEFLNQVSSYQLLKKRSPLHRVGYLLSLSKSQFKNIFFVQQILTTVHG